jgi:uncharacterized membrane protein YecN with MAPEG domain
MMTPIIVPAYAAIFAFVFILLALRVIKLRYSKRIAIGTRGDAVLERRMRVHANFAEYVPFALLLLAFLEMQAHSRYLIHLLALALLAARLVHAYGVSQENEDIRLRTAAMVTTFAVLAVAAVALLFNALRAALG